MPSLAEMLAARKQAQPEPTTAEELANYVPQEVVSEVVDADVIRLKLQEIEQALITTGAVRQPVVFIYEQLQKTPELAEEVLKPDDIKLLTRAMRALYKSNVAVSQTRKTKTAQRKTQSSQTIDKITDGISL